MPGEYAAVRNVLREMKLRLGDDWLTALTSADGAGTGGVVEVSGSLGSGVWALADVLGHLEEELVSDITDEPAPATTEQEVIRSTSAGRLAYRYVHPGRAGVELAQRLFAREFSTTHFLLGMIVGPRYRVLERCLLWPLCCMTAQLNTQVYQGPASTCTLTEHASDTVSASQCPS